VQSFALLDSRGRLSMRADPRGHSFITFWEKVDRTSMRSFALLDSRGRLSLRAEGGCQCEPRVAVNASRGWLCEPTLGATLSLRFGEKVDRTSMQSFALLDSRGRLSLRAGGRLSLRATRPLPTWPDFWAGRRRTPAAPQCDRPAVAVAQSQELERVPRARAECRARSRRRP
jgi:hypothetical protein